MDTLLVFGGVLFLFLSGSAALAIGRVIRRSPVAPQRSLRAAAAIACAFALSAISAVAGVVFAGARAAAVPTAVVLYAGSRVALEVLSRREKQTPLPPHLRARLRRSSVLLGVGIACELALAVPTGMILGWAWGVGLLVLALLAVPTALRQRRRASA